MKLSRLEAALLGCSRGPFLKPDGTGEGGPTGPTGDTGSTAATGVTGGNDSAPAFTAEQNAHIGKLLSDERKKTRDAAKHEFESDAQRKADEDKAAREQKDLEAKGEFEQVKTKLESDLSAAKGEVKTLKERTDALEAAMAKVLEDDWSKLPADVLDVYTAAGGDVDDALAKLEFLPKAKTLADKLDGAKEKRRGSAENPPPKHGENGQTVDDEKVALRRTGQYARM